jgi:hypothetical protein
MRHRAVFHREKNARYRQCTGCQRYIDMCICGRAKQHCCAGCGKKLWDRGGKQVWWGKETRELCPECAALVPPSVLLDARK